jgi:solute:Na+ symporter, SSS family
VEIETRSAAVFVAGGDSALMTSPGFSLSLLDVLIVVGSIVAVVWVGLRASRGAGTTSRDYFAASGRLPWWMIGMAFVSTSVSSEQIVGTVGAAYKGGLSIANWEWWCLPTFTLLLVFFIPIYLRSGVLTVPELLRRRFGPWCGDLYSGVMLLGYVFIFLAPVLYGGSVTFSRLTGWPLWAVLIGTGALVLAYTTKGGLISVMWTDALQCVLLVGGGVALFFLALARVPGGWPAMVAAAPERFHLYQPAGDPEAPFLGLILGTFGVFLFYQSTNQVMVQRVLGARSLWDGLMGIVFAGFINLFRPLTTCLLGLVVWHWTEKMGRAPSMLPDRQDDVFPFALAEFAPNGLRGLILAGFVAAVMSTVSSLANSIGTIFSLELYARLRGPSAGDRELIRAGRIAAAAALLIATCVAPAVGSVGIFKYFQTGVTYLATPFVSVLLLGLLWPRTSYPAAVAGLIGGVLIQIGLAFVLPRMQVNLHWLYVGALAQALTMLLIVAVTLVTAPARPEQWEPFRWRPALLTSLGEATERPWWQSVRLWFAVYAVLWVGVYWWFW